MSSFGYEGLIVWQKSVDLAVDIIEFADSLDLPRKHYRLLEQIESSSVSIPSNIAEGKGRNSKKEYVQFLYIARGSLYEVMTYLEVFWKKCWLSEEKYNEFKNRGLEIAKMIKGLINSFYKQ